LSSITLQRHLYCDALHCVNIVAIFKESTMTTITLKDSHGKSHIFNLYPKGTHFKPMAGVYAFLKEKGDSLFDVIYIGQTSDFEDRIDDNFTNHTQYDCIIQNRYTHIATLVVPEQHKRLEIEKSLIDNFNTSCNEQ